MKFPEHLDHLRRDRRGIPVPYVNRWGTAEDEALVSIRHDPHVGLPAVFYDDRGFDTPDFTAQSLQRQRECVTQGLCQVCAKFVPWSRRYLVFADLSTEVVVTGGRRVSVITEPWLCGRCTETAVTACPALIRRKREERLHVVPISSQQQTTLIVSRGYLDGPLREESLRVQPAMWAKIAVAGVSTA